MKDFNLIVAVSLNGVIGNSEINDLPWRLPSDLKNFKAITSGDNKTVIMGRNTWNSLPSRPLKGRRNVVISSHLPSEGLYDQADQGYPSLEGALSMESLSTNFADNELFVIGGARLYEECLKHSPHKMYITLVHLELPRTDGDVKFPIDGIMFRDEIIYVEGVQYVCTDRSATMTENDINFQFVEFTRA